MTLRRLTILTAVVAMAIVQAVPAVGQDGDLEAGTASVDATQVAYTSSVPGMYPVSALVTGPTLQRGLALDRLSGFLFHSDQIEDEIVVSDHAGRTRLTFGVTGDGSGQLDRPDGIAVSGNEVFVAESGNNRVQVFDRQGNHLRMWGSEGSLPGQFDRPQDVEVVGGFVYVSDSENHRVQVFTKAGNYVNRFGSLGTGNGELDLGSGGALTHSGGEIFVADKQNHRVAVFDLDGNWERNIGVGTLDLPEVVDADSKGQIWVADYATSTVTVWSSVGAPLGLLGGPGTTLGTFGAIRGLVVDPSGDSVWVADFAGGSARIQVLTRLQCAGELLTHVGTSYYDKLVTGDMNDVIHLGAGNDKVSTGAGNDTVCAGPGRDTVNGQGGADDIWGASGKDTINGGAGRDSIVGGSGADQINGGKGNDEIRGGKGGDVIDGGLGDDRIWGGPKGDELRGNAGDDVLRGESGNDTLKGGKDTDKCFGGPGGNDQASACETTGGIP